MGRCRMLEGIRTPDFRMKPRYLLCLPLLLLLAMGALLGGCRSEPLPLRLTNISGHMPDLDFKLTDDNGKAVTGAEYRGKVAGRHNLTGFGGGGLGRMVKVGIRAGRRSDRMHHDRNLQGLEAQRNAYDSDLNELDRLILHFEQYARGIED